MLDFFPLVPEKLSVFAHINVYSHSTLLTEYLEWLLMIQVSDDCSSSIRFWLMAHKVALVQKHLYICSKIPKKTKYVPGNNTLESQQKEDTNCDRDENLQWEILLVFLKRYYLKNSPKDFGDWLEQIPKKN